jgi:hypothetical protein
MGTHAAAVALYPNLAYKPDLDFEPIGLASSIPAIIVARKISRRTTCEHSRPMSKPMRTS